MGHTTADVHFGNSPFLSLQVTLWCSVLRKITLLAVILPMIRNYDLSVKNYLLILTSPCTVAKAEVSVGISWYPSN
jgi:hypothetical protein